MSEIEIVRPLGTSIFVPPGEAGGVSVDETILVNSRGEPLVSEELIGDLEGWDPQGTLILDDDFSSYADTSELLDVSAPGNPWDGIGALIGAEFFDASLDTSPPSGSTNGRAMRFNMYGTGPNGGDRLGDREISAEKLFPSGVSQVWVEMRVQFSSNWTIDHPDDSSYNEWKFLFLHRSEGRYDIKARNPYFWGIADGEVYGFDPPGVPGVGDIRGQWVTVRTMFRSGVAAQAYMSIDEDVLWNMDFTGTEGDFTSARIGANLNWTSADDQFVWFDRIKIHTFNPG